MSNLHYTVSNLIHVATTGPLLCPGIVQPVVRISDMDAQCTIHLTSTGLLIYPVISNHSQE